MTRTILFAAAIMLAGSPFFASPPSVAQQTSAEAVLQAHVDAVGGADAWDAIENTHTEAEVMMETPQGILVLGLESYSIFPGYTLTLISEIASLPGMPPLDQVMYMTSEGGFITGPQGRQELDELPPNMSSGRSLEFALAELALLATDTLDVQLGAPDSLRGRPMDVVNVGGATPTTRYYDAETHLLFAVEMEGPQGKFRNFSSDYRDVGDLKFAFLQVMNMGTMTQTITVSNVRINGDLTPERLKELSQQ